MTTRKDGDGALPPFLLMPTEPYEEHLLAAPDCCVNCLRLIRVERIDPTRDGFGTEFESHFSRRKRTTSVEFAPSDAPPRSKGVFCECGVEGHRERLWSPGHISRDRFKQLLVNAVRTLELKDVSLKRKETLAYALQAFDNGAGPDAAIAEAIDAGIVAQAASSDTTDDADAKPHRVAD